MAESQRFTEAQQDPTGILDTALAAGANILSAEIDNRDARLTRLALALEWLNAGAAGAGGLINAYLVHSLDGNYEDGAASLDPHTTPVAYFRDNAGTTRQRQAEIGIPIGPFRFKVLLESTLSQNSTVRLVACTWEKVLESLWFMEDGDPKSSHLPSFLSLSQPSHRSGRDGP